MASAPTAIYRIPIFHMISHHFVPSLSHTGTPDSMPFWHPVISPIRKSNDLHIICHIQKDYTKIMKYSI